MDSWFALLSFIEYVGYILPLIWVLICEFPQATLQLRNDFPGILPEYIDLMLKKQD